MKRKTLMTEDKDVIQVMVNKTFNENYKDELLIFKENGEYRGTYYNWVNFLSKNKVVECFNNLYFTNINGKSHSIILENNTYAPSEIIKASEYAVSMGLGKIKNILQTFSDLSKSSSKEGYSKYLYDYILENKIKNVFIDSIFKDKVQLETLAKEVFCFTLNINIFVNSHDVLLDTLNSYSSDNDFKRLVSVCNIYDIKFSENVVYAITYNYIKSKFEYGSKYYITWE